MNQDKKCIFSSEESHSDWLRAKEIIFRHTAVSGESLGIQEMIITQEGGIRMFRADWVVELEAELEEKYGPSKARQVLNQVVTKLLIQESIVH